MEKMSIEHWSTEKIGALSPAVLGWVSVDFLEILIKSFRLLTINILKVIDYFNGSVQFFHDRLFLKGPQVIS